MAFVNGLFFYAMICIWTLLIVNIVLLFFGYRFSEEIRTSKKKHLTELKNFPKVSILIPAHNEGRVISRTLKAMGRLEYPKDAYEVIVINDNSSDDTADVIEKTIKSIPDCQIRQMVLTGAGSGKGKSNALNHGLAEATGEYIAVYDADNTPNPLALRYLVSTIEGEPKYGAVIGKFRTRNKNKNMLTRFINIETLTFQWMAQAGRWKLFGLCTIPGTNFIVRKEILTKLGGWDVKAIAEDTEISFRIYQMGYKIAFMPLSETYEQEPETLRVWLKQRKRWVSGNIYVLMKNIMNLHRLLNFGILFDLFYFFAVYFLFLTSIIISDLFFVVGLFKGFPVDMYANYTVIWILSYLVFLLQLTITLSIEKGESSRENVILSAVMYFSYCQLWLIVSLTGLYEFIKTQLSGKKHIWYKTERF